jgi:uncharacterized protein (TIRG00374 family)
LALTVLFGWLALRDVDLAEVRRALATADWFVLLAISLPSYGVLLWLRALRWRYLTDPICRMRLGALFRAVAVGFMANNLFPLRMGEVVRSWILARETNTSAATIFGTIVLERVLDAIAVILLVVLVLMLRGSDGASGVLGSRALLLVPVALVPLAGLVLLKAMPDRVLALSRFVLRPVPRLADFAERMLTRFQEGLGALAAGTHLVWLAVYTVLIWGVASTLPIVAVFLALGLDLGGPGQMLVAAWTTQAAVGVAVAVPSAPGFFGLFHWACRFALVGLGIEPATALAAGTLLHGVMWVTLTTTGLLVLRIRHTSLGAVEAATESPSP